MCVFGISPKQDCVVISRERKEREKVERERAERERVERERAERERAEREQRERAELERQDRERKEREEQERIENERRERAVILKESAAAVAVDQHFSESLRLAHQKVRQFDLLPEFSPSISYIHDILFNYRSFQFI